MPRRTISHEEGAIYEFTPDLDPIATVEPGAELTVETRDSLDGAIQTDEDVLASVPAEVNAATGPIEIDGASPGDVLAVEIEDVRVSEDRGRVITIDGFGLLDGHESIEAPRTTITPVEEDAIVFDGHEVPIDPCIGTIGVGTAGDTHTTLVPHDHGGNLDTTDMSAGNTAYFPVFQDGAMLAMGDSKAAMADGEMCGTGSEIATDVDVTVDVIDGDDVAVDVERPLIETPDAWKTIASAETMEEACELANLDAIELLVSEHGFNETKAYKFSSLVGGLEISQVVDPLVTVRNAIPKAHCSGPF